jgi:hypothetical protein
VRAPAIAGGFMERRFGISAAAFSAVKMEPSVVGWLRMA